MTIRALGESEREATAASPFFERFAGGCAILAGVGSVLYSLSFLVVQSAALSALFLLLGGLLALPVLSAVYQHVAQTQAAFARWAFLLSVTGALGGLIHGGYDLANALHPPASIAAQAGLPDAVDPRGLLVFGIAGLGLFLIAWLIGQHRRFPRSLSYPGYITALLLIGLYLGRLLILDPASPLIALSALLGGFVLNPLWYIWLGIVLVRG
jgi:hypothetical protein